MKDIPILFSGPMVRANLAGTKTQTRRAWRDQPPAGVRIGYVPNETRTPYGHAGDRLWQREAFSGLHEYRDLPPSEWPVGSPIWYWADGDPPDGDWTKPKPSMFMPRWACRQLLLVKQIRVERLQDISEEDAIAEGCNSSPLLRGDDDMAVNHAMSHAPWAHRKENSFLGMPAPVARYVVLWDSINGKTLPWHSNPLVWAVTYERIA